MAEMTDAQLSERVCKVLGIEPELRWWIVLDGKPVCDSSLESTALARLDGYRRKEYQGNGKWQRALVQARPRYHNVFDWPGFGMAVERLRERHPDALIELTIDPTYNHTCRLIVDGKPYERTFADTLPRALALAVIAMEGR